MLGFSTFLDTLGGPALGEAAKIFAVALLVAFVVVGVRLVGADARLAHARRQTAEVAAERDRALAELIASRDAIARLEQALAEQDENIRINMASADRRLAEAQLAVGRAEAVAVAREGRIRDLLAADPRSGESRCETANRLITDALREQRS